jgi:hypothetical protein
LPRSIICRSNPPLDRFQRLLRPGGTLAVVGLYRLSTLADFAWAHVGLAVSTWYRTTRRSEPVAAPIRDPNETLGDIRTSAQKVLPGAVVTRLLLFRYSMLWRKNLAGGG